MVSRIEALFPGLVGSGYRITSPKHRRYNCIAWAAADTHHWWWPTPVWPAYWPDGITRSVTLPAFQEAFASLGYVVCDHEEYETGFEKIALFADQQGLPTHAARQLPNGRWTSKLGKLEDIEHALHDLAGTEYGSVVLIMKRSAAT